MFSKRRCGCSCLKRCPQSSTEEINAHAKLQTGQPEDVDEDTRTTLFLSSPLFHLIAGDLNIQGNKKNTGLWCAGRMTTVQLSPRSCEGAHVTRGTSPLVCALFLKLCWDQRLREALIRGRAVCQVSYEPGPPTCTMSSDPLRNCIANFEGTALQIVRTRKESSELHYKT